MMEENFTPCAFINFHNSDAQNSHFSSSPATSFSDPFDLQAYASGSLYGSAPNSQKASPNSLSPLTRATSEEDADKSSLFSSSDCQDAKDIHANSSTS